MINSLDHNITVCFPPTNVELIERWEQCQRVLEGLDEHARQYHWDMGGFVTDTSCGTVCCAAGFCCFDPWFNAHGLIVQKFTYRSNGETYYFLPSGMWLKDFFGKKGSAEIFHNTTRRSVETVIEEVKQHVEFLKKNSENITVGVFYELS